MAASYARGVLVSKSLTLPKGVHDGFLPVNNNKNLSRSGQGWPPRIRFLSGF
jgi:hypothetical protein